MAAAQSDQRLMERAGAARRAGRFAEARALLDELLASSPGNPLALNALGLICLDEGDADAAAASFERAAAADPQAPPPLINLAQAHRALGHTAAEIGSLDRALAINPYFLPALLAKADALERCGDPPAALAVYKAVVAVADQHGALPPGLDEAVGHARALLADHSRQFLEDIEQPLRDIAAAFPSSDLGRARAYAEHRAGARKVYFPEPTGGLFPFLPALEFFPRELFPWLGQLEAATGAIRAELESLLAEQAAGFAPYVRFGPGDPVNQWAELNHSRRWSAWFLWQDGVRDDEHCARCPQTAQAVEALPMLDLPGKGPTAMFSVLEPRTAIPPHTGTSNVRATVHLPLIVPPGCSFRVGGDTRQWREGEAWAFDDTIEHEARNDSDQLRVILIVDAWNPLLTEAERAAVRQIG